MTEGEELKSSPVSPCRLWAGEGSSLGIQRSQLSLALAEGSWDYPYKEEDLATLQSSVKQRAEAQPQKHGFLQVCRDRKT